MIRFVVVPRVFDGASSWESVIELLEAAGCIGPPSAWPNSTPTAAGHYLSAVFPEPSFPVSTGR